MAKKLFVLIIAFACSFIGMSCKKDTKDNDPLLKEQIEQAYKTIKVSADSILLSVEPISGFVKMKPEYEKLNGVKSVAVSENALYIVFENGAELIWFIPNLEQITLPPRVSISENPLIQTLTIAKNPTTLTKNALLINQTYNDERFVGVRNYIQSLKNKLETQEWHVTIKNGNDANLNFFKKELSNYDVLFIVTHGTLGITGSPYFLTGEEANDFMHAWYVWDLDPELYVGATIPEERIRRIIHGLLHNI